VIALVDIFIHEAFKTIRLLLTQPLLYWVVFLLIISSYERVERERINFGYKIFNIGKEWRDTFIFSLVFGLLLSLIMVGTGFVFSYEIIYLINIIVILFSISTRYTLLSASYTIGTVYLLVLLLPFVLSFQQYFPSSLFMENNLSGIAIFLGLLLFVEAFLVKRIKPNNTYPSLRKSKRGVWIGQHHLRKLSILPIFLLVPHGLIEPFSPYWPVMHFGVDTYSIILLPMAIGFDHEVKGTLPQIVAQKLFSSLTVLALVVTILGVGSIYLSWLSFIAVLVALMGREFIKYKLQEADHDRIPYFTNLNEGVRVLSIIPESPAEKLKIQVGETILRVNGQTIKTPKEFYQSLQDSGAFFKLDVLDVAGEVKFIQGAFYEGDDHNLGIIFPQERYHKINSKKDLEKSIS